jgi:hypothetical protein
MGDRGMEIYQEGLEGAGTERGALPAIVGGDDSLYSPSARGRRRPRAKKIARRAGGRERSVCRAGEGEARCAPRGSDAGVRDPEDSTPPSPTRVFSFLPASSETKTPRPNKKRRPHFSSLSTIKTVPHQQKSINTWLINEVRLYHRVCIGSALTSYQNHAFQTFDLCDI